jgi:predicted glycosyltransferase
MDLSDAFALRRRMIKSAVERFKPDVFLVDSRPTGLNGELSGILERRTTSGIHCRTVLILRDIVDDPQFVTQRWSGDGTYTVIDEAYNKVVIFGNQSVFDAAEQYQLTRFRNKTFHLGYLGDPWTCAVDCDTAMGSARVDRILVTVGGGFDGDDIIDTVCQYAVDRGRKHQHLGFTIVLGTHSPLTAAGLCGRYRDLAHHADILRHVSNLEALIAAAPFVVSMCGYNTLIELIQRKKKIIAVPRGHSGREQTIRADVLKGVYDGMWVIPENDITPETLGSMVDVVLTAPSPTVRVEMEGAGNLVRFLNDEVWRDP